MLNFIKIIFLGIFFLSFVNCSKRENPGLGVNDGLKRGKFSKKRDKEYAVDLKITTTNDLIKKNKIKLIEKAKKNQKVIFKLKFNTGSNEKFKILEQHLVSSCKNKISKISYNLVTHHKNKKKKDFYKNINVLKQYSVKPNTDYIYEVTTTPYGCDYFEISAAVWLGGAREQPEPVRVCNYKKHKFAKEGFIYFLNLASPITVYSSFDKKLFGKRVICAEKLDYKEVSVSIEGTTGSVQGELVANNGDQYNYEMIFGNKTYGTLTCRKNGKIYRAAELLNCVEKVVDKRDFN